MKNIFIAIIVIVMLPLLFASISQSSDSGNQELKGFSARDIQYIESIGFVDNLDGSWTLSTYSGLLTTRVYYFDFQPYGSTSSLRAVITALYVTSPTSIRLFTKEQVFDINATLILWGGDVS